jgi:hypothetical protein
MDLRMYVDNLQHQLAVAADAGGEEARALAERLVAPMDAAIRLTLQDVLAAAVEEITRELAPGSVELRLRGRDPEFVVTAPSVDRPVADRDEGDDRESAAPSAAPSPPVDADDSAMSRINLRLPEQLKSRVEDAAGTEGLSVNSWLVRAATSALERNDSGRRRGRRNPPGTQRYTGWAR